MANIAISALPVATSQAGADVLPIVQATTSTTKQLTITNLFTSPAFVTPALGTPASGIVTNLTGTASININGTVGATTPAAATVTTLVASGATIGASNAIMTIGDNSRTVSTSKTTGAIVCGGGLGVWSDIFTGGAISTTGNQVISSTGKQGYATGAGGTVTQATSKATGVTLSKSTGQITLNAAALASDTTVSFTLTNTVIEAGDILIMNHISAGTAGSYLLNAQSAAGSASINVRNITAGSLSEAIVIAFAVIKAVTA